MAPRLPSFTPTYHHDVYPAIDPTQPALDCSDKIILITGGGRGIGKAIALGFAKAKAKGIVLLGRDDKTLKSSAAEIRILSPSTEVFVTTADIQKQDQVHKALQDIVAHFGTVPHVLVNNAGGLRGQGPIIDVDISDFWESFELNTRGPLIVSQAFLRLARTEKKVNRTIINISSGAAHVPYAPGIASYSCSKAATCRIMEFLHHENPECQIFNVQPGVVATDLSRGYGRKAEDSGELPAGFAVWLARSPDAGVFSGKFLWANWDVGELLSRKEEILREGLLEFGLKGWSEGGRTDDAKGVHGDAEG